MRSRPKRLHIGLAILFVAFYLAVLSRNLSESQRRSLLMDQAPIAADQVRMSIRITSVNPGGSELTARIRVRLDGSIAKDPVTPAVDLKLFLNDIRGSQEIDFPRGRRMNSIQATFSLDGNINRYPFDSYRTALRMVVTKPANNVRPKVSPDTTDDSTAPFAETDSGLWINTPNIGDSVPIISSIAASLPGLKFDGTRVERPDNDMEGFDLIVRRADSVIVVSILIMVLMMTLAMSVMFMSIEALTSHERLDLLPLTLSITLLFGLPALRNSQPAVPPLGAFGDYLSFLWAEQIVAVAAVFMIWSWLARGRHNQHLT